MLYKFIVRHFGLRKTLPTFQYDHLAIVAAVGLLIVVAAVKFKGHRFVAFRGGPSHSRLLHTAQGVEEWKELLHGADVMHGQERAALTLPLHNGMVET